MSTESNIKSKWLNLMMYYSIEQMHIPFLPRADPASLHPVLVSAITLEK